MAVLPQLGQPPRALFSKMGPSSIGETEAYNGGGAGLSQDQNQQDPVPGSQ